MKGAAIPELEAGHLEDARPHPLRPRDHRTEDILAGVPVAAAEQESAMVVGGVAGEPEGHRGLVGIPDVEQGVHLFVRAFHMHVAEVFLPLRTQACIGCIHPLWIAVFVHHRGGLRCMILARHHPEQKNQALLLPGLEEEFRLQRRDGVTGGDLAVAAAPFGGGEGIGLGAPAADKALLAAIPAAHRQGGGEEGIAVPGLVGLFNRRAGVGDPITLARQQDLLAAVEAHLVEMLVVGLVDQVDEGVAEGELLKSEEVQMPGFGEGIFEGDLPDFEVVLGRDVIEEGGGDAVVE
ncbi:MAG: hypothetical protein BWY77_01896 [bacterium ADurb.Bin431]|nr:MAG: hypothetical protein BWY77_01896 [bacterium ADurb.Bin431]